MKKIFFIPVATALMLAICAGCSPAAKKNGGGNSVPVLVAQATLTNVPVKINPPPVGHVMAFSTVSVHSQIQGLISAIHFKEGQEVKKGDPLFSIDPRPTQSVLAQAKADLQRDQAQLEYAKVDFTRQQKLFDQKLISQDQLDTNRASLDALVGTIAADKAAIKSAALNLEFCEITAPVDGVAGSLQSYVGNVVKAPDDTLVTINQIHPIYVQFAVPESLLPQIQKEMTSRALKVSVTYDGMNTSPPQGELTFVDNSVDASTGQIALRATFKNENNALWPGQFVEAQLTLSELTNAVVVPSQAVQDGQNGEFIYVVEQSPTNADIQVVEERPVTVGISYGNHTVIAKGLNADETVVTDGQLKLAPGIKVNTKSSAKMATDSATKLSSPTNTP